MTSASESTLSRWTVCTGEENNTSIIWSYHHMVGWISHTRFSFVISSTCRSLPNVEHVFEQAQRDKMVTLRDVLARHRSKGLRTLIFCNTVQSCRAVEYAINQDAVPGGSFGGDQEDIHATSYHGDLNSLERAKNLERFRSGASNNNSFET